MKYKKGGKARTLNRLTEEEKAEIEKKRLEKLQQDHEKKENEMYEKYVSELRQQNIRAALLSDVLKSIDAMRRAHIKYRRNKLEVKKWDEYVTCSALPNTNNPPAMREFIYRWRKEIQDDITNNFSWALDVNELSLLTQDMFQPNLCFWKLSNEQPTIGNQYVTRIDQCLALLKELDLALMNSTDPALKEIKNELRTQLGEVLDQFTFRILTNIERDMQRIDARTAKLSFKTKSFSSSFWTTRPVPQISSYWTVIGYTQIDFPEIDASLFVNNDIGSDGFSYRGLLKNFDHFSDTAPSNHLTIKFPPTPDLRSANDMEWRKREEIMSDILDQMRADRAKWEQKELERAAKEEEERKTKRGKGPLKKSEKKKNKPGPPLVTERTVVDVSAEYTKYEEDLLAEQNALISPDSFKLSPDEINLREFRIIGGVYALNYLIRPEQYTQLKPQFLYKLDTRHILKHANFVATKDFDLIEVRVKLSKDVNWWVHPIICYWQPWEESDEFLALSPELQDFHINYKKYTEKLEQLLFSGPEPKLKYHIVKCLKDFQLNKLPHDIDFLELINEYLVPRMPITYKFEVELDAVREILRKEALRQKEVEMERFEEQQRRRFVFDAEMKEYLAKVRAHIDEEIAKMTREFDEYYVQQRNHLINLGEHELQIGRFLNHKKAVNDDKLRDFDLDEMTKYRDYVDEQFRLRILAFETENVSAIEKTRSHVEKTSPRELYLVRKKQMPLKIVNDETVYNFDVPNETDAPAYDGQITDTELLSTFFRYLILLTEKNKPILKDKPQHLQMKVIAPVEDATSPDLPEATTKENTSTLDKSQKIQKTRKEKTPKKSTKKPKATKKVTEKSSPKTKKKPKKTNKKSPKIKSIRTKTDNAEIVEIVAPPPPEKIVKIIKNTRKHKQELRLIPHFGGKWITSGINQLGFDSETREIKFQISRFGTFGFALPRYCNFPLNYWEVYPNANKRHSVMLKIIGKYSEIKIEIVEDGYLIERILPNNINFVPNKTEMQYRDLKEFLRKSGLNVFPERDTRFYVEGISEKHRSMEDHTYYCMAQFTLSHYFRFSPFNRVSNHRTVVFELYEQLDNVKLPDKFTEVMVTPQTCYTIEVAEVTSKTGETNLNYKMVPAEQEHNPDVYNLLMANSNELSKRYHDQMKRVHRFNVAQLLLAIRPFSFS